MNHQVSLLLKKFCELKNFSYNAGKRAYKKLNTEQKTKMITGMKLELETDKMRRIFKQA